MTLGAVRCPRCSGPLRGSRPRHHEWLWIPHWHILPPVEQDPVPSAACGCSRNGRIPDCLCPVGKDIAQAIIQAYQDGVPNVYFKLQLQLRHHLLLAGPSPASG